MSIYNPDKWVMLKIVNPEYTTYKILASWYGGYTSSDSWKLSSGTVSQTITNNIREYLQDSGSIYSVRHTNYGMSSYSMSIYDSFVNQMASAPPGCSLELMELDDVLALDPSVFGAWNT